MIAEDWHRPDLCMHGNWVRFPSMLANTVAWRNRLNSHPPVGVGRVVLHSRQRGDILVAWREMADRVGRAGVTGERERLAAAPPKSISRRAQLAHGSCIQAVPRKALKAGEFAQMSASECSRTDQNSRPGMNSAAWQGSTLPAGVTFSERRPQPPTHGFGNRA